MALRGSFLHFGALRNGDGLILLSKTFPELDTVHGKKLECSSNLYYNIN